MVVYAGGGGGAEYTGLHLFHVKGTTPVNTKAVEGTVPRYRLSPVPKRRWLSLDHLQWDMHTLTYLDTRACRYQVMCAIIPWCARAPTRVLQSL
jgi:hypothetical protein